MMWTTLNPWRTSQSAMTFLWHLHGTLSLHITVGLEPESAA